MLHYVDHFEHLHIICIIVMTKSRVHLFSPSLFSPATSISFCNPRLQSCMYGIQWNHSKNANIFHDIIYLSQTKYSRNSLENIVLCDASLKYFFIYFLFFLYCSISLIQSNESDASVHSTQGEQTSSRHRFSFEE